MKKILTTAALLIGMSGVAQAALNTYTFTTTDLSSLDHGSYYTWGIDLRTQGINVNNVSITAASITFNNIYNWQPETYYLWVRLLERNINNTIGTKAPVGISSASDGIGDGNAYDNFTGNGKLLKYFTNPDISVNAASTSTITLDITSYATDLLNYAKTATTGIIGLGFDPDCHFYDSRIDFKITTSSGPDAVPEPATMLLFGTGLAGLAGVRMRRKKS